MVARASIELVCDDGRIWRERDTGKIFTLVDDAKPAPDDQPDLMYFRMMTQQTEGDMERTLEMIDESKIERLRTLERFFTDIAHQLLEKRFEDYAGKEPRRIKHRMVEVDYSLVPLLYAAAIRDLAEAEAGK